VVECVVTRDKVTRLSKGSAFLWYTNAVQSDLAIASLNNVVLCPSVRDGPVRLVVKRAFPRVPVANTVATAALLLGSQLAAANTGVAELAIGGSGATGGQGSLAQLHPTLEGSVCGPSMQLSNAPADQLLLQQQQPWVS